MVQTLASSKAMTSMAQVQARFALDYAIDPALVLPVMPPSRNQLPQVLRVLRSLACKVLENLAKQGSQAKYDTVLAKVPDIEPEEYDRLPTKKQLP
jgi:hypothetical protein